MNATEPIKEPSPVTLPQLGASHQPLRQVVTDALRKAILGKALKPGERLVEEQLAADSGSRATPCGRPCACWKARAWWRSVPAAARP